MAYGAERCPIQGIHSRDTTAGSCISFAAHPHRDARCGGDDPRNVSKSKKIIEKRSLSRLDAFFYFWLFLIRYSLFFYFVYLSVIIQMLDQKE